MPRNSPRYPVYVISKGRWESRLTAKALEAIGVPYHIVIEPQEYEQYAAVIDPAKIRTLPFSNLGYGSIPARNWVWEDAVARGAIRHWILDDNIREFYRLTKHVRYRCVDGTPFVICEDVADRYENVALAGLQYLSMAPARTTPKPLILNTRVYSCILIQNDIPYRWRGRYNEDTDLSIRALKDGWCTFILNAFLANKMPTLRMKGGNTDELYAGEGRLAMAQSLVAQHPDIVRIYRRWGRWQHVVDYSSLRRNRLRLRPGVTVPTGVDEYGLTLAPTGR